MIVINRMCKALTHHLFYQQVIPLDRLNLKRSKLGVYEVLSDRNIDTRHETMLY
jgi:hypothetical protein